MEKFKMLPERVGKKEKSVKAVAPMVQRLIIVNQDPLKLPLPGLVLKMEL